MPAENITLHAKWTINSYTISFNSNGGSAVASIIQNYGTAVTQPADPTKTGYTFAGWYADAGLTSSYTFTTMPAQNTTLYAKWTANMYVLEFRDYNGTILQTGSYAFESSLAAVTPPTPPTRSGYTFSGWSASIPATMPANNVTITALYVINYVTITFNSNGGTAVAPIVSQEGMAITEPAAPTKTGFTFGGWFIDVALTNKFTFITTPPRDLTLYAKWLTDQEAVQQTINEILLGIQNGYFQNLPVSNLSSPEMIAAIDARVLFLETKYGVNISIINGTRSGSTYTFTFQVTKSTVTSTLQNVVATFRKV